MRVVVAPRAPHPPWRRERGAGQAVTTKSSSRIAIDASLDRALRYPPMPLSNCTACSATLDDSDNFCRACGAALAETQLPATRDTASVTLWRPQASPVVKGAAVMAAGTIGQFVFRRVVSNLFSTAPKKPRHRAVRVRRTNDGLLDEAQIITETVMMRRVRIRRQA